jgi:hypothetical protein
MEAGRREVSVDGTQVKRGDCGGARLVSLRRQNDARKARYHTRLTGKGIRGRPHHASVGAEFKKRCSIS